MFIFASYHGNLYAHASVKILTYSYLVKSIRSKECTTTVSSAINEQKNAYRVHTHEQPSVRNFLKSC